MRSILNVTFGFLSVSPLPVLLATLLLATPADAAPPPIPCGTADHTVRPPTTADALFVLRAAVGFSGTCGVCLCDVDSSGKVGVTDALLVLRRAVGVAGELRCPPCPCTALTLLDTGINPSSVVAVDLDDDGHLDLLSADLKSDSVSIFSGSGRGRLVRTDVVATGQTPQHVTAADLNDDGNIDIVTSDALPNQVTVRLGNDAGGFDPAVSYPVGEAPINTVAADVNGDEHLDLVVTNSLSDNLSVLLGDGAGSFTAGDLVAVGAGPRWVSLALVDGDQILDAVVANRDSDDLSILVGDGDGGFGNETRIAVCDEPYHVSIGDLDDDGNLDLVVPCTGSEAVAVLLAKNNGFKPAVLYAAGGKAIATELAYVNGDDVLDIVSANFAGAFPAASVFLGAGDGTFAEPILLRGGGKSRALDVADIDEDGTADIVLANAGSDDLTILHGIGDGTFVGSLESPASGETLDLEVADLDLDGFDDVATGAFETGFLTVQIADGTGHFDRTTYPMGGAVQAVDTGRVNNDVVPDLIAFTVRFASGEYGQSADTLIGNGDGEFAAAESTELYHSDNFIYHATADIDGDLRSDIAIGKEAIELWRGQPDGSFQSFGQVETAEGFPVVALADVDRDGDNDLIELARLANIVRVHRNKGDGTFGSPKSYAVSADQSLAVHDMNRDGAVDLVVFGQQSVSVLRNDGSGAFLPEVTSTLPLTVFRYALDDFDGDGAADLATMSSTDVILFQGDVLGHFATQELLTVPITVGTHVREVDSGRFDPSKYPSIVAAARVGFGHHALVVLRDVGNCLAP
jgi:hypothetical protein